MNMTNQEIKILKTLSELHAISGQENDVAHYLLNQFSSYGLTIIQDHLGSIAGLKKSKTNNAKKVLLLGHMDEIGFIVQDILAHGMIKLAAIGGINPLTLTGQRMRIKTKQGTVVHGAIDTTPPHLLKDTNQGVPTVESVFLDVGLPSKQAVLDSGIYLGAMVTYDVPFQVLHGGKRLLGKAFDNRYSLAMLLTILKHFKNIELPYDLYVGASVQEEVGLRGARTLTHAIQPDFAIILDCSPARDSSGDHNELGKLGGGVLLRYIDASMIARPTLLAFQEAMAKKAKVPYQYYYSPGGTDAGAVHQSGAGVMTLTHCIVARSIHSPSTIMDTDDFDSSKKTLITMLKTFNENKLNQLAKDDH
jgi:glutamyl aminopeptidase